ncbi:MAG: amidohydrolase family protein, partial [candidate division Zixibacteria bacterium]|nr:amidohydrolase family protein [candidate division Zixibacteria bacterium]NIS48387.1 amidohydrolase family protein [candidate division Zixibacteria bacterium]NIU16509.1 amidohydrolase family protein [candidate division Zixibacteria bacterium]NIV08627.1 amidohydrolase family protein [candidate division Zixibacteria bacterium]NIW39771.1 amidohydrolase family protein [candidate division Zixibacteria bacterium]
TQGAAYAGYFENEIGQLKPGFQADLIVLENDPFELPPDELGQIKPIATLFNNQWVWVDPETTSINLY